MVWADAWVVQHTARYDTLTFWMKDTMTYYMDTLQMSITYLATDTTNTLVTTTDTLRLIPKKSRERILKDAARKAEEDQKELDKQLRKLEKAGDSIGIVNLLKPKIKFLKTSLTSGTALSIYKQITLEFTEPVTFSSDTSVHVYIKADTIWNPVPFELEQDSLNILKYNIYAEWKPAETFKITVDSASITGLYGLHNDLTESTLKFNELSILADLHVGDAEIIGNLLLVPTVSIVFDRNLEQLLVAQDEGADVQTRVHVLFAAVDNPRVDQAWDAGRRL